MAKKFGVNRRWVQEWCQQMDKLQKLKKSFICRFGWKDFPSYYKYIHSRAIFVLEKGGVLLLGTVLLLGHIRYASFIQVHHYPVRFCSYRKHNEMSVVYSTFIAKCPKIFFSVSFASTCHSQMPYIHYHRRFSERANIVIRRLLTLNDHCVQIWLKTLCWFSVLFGWRRCVNLLYYLRKYSCNLRIYAVCVILTVHLVRA